MKELLERRRIDRLGHVVIEAGLLGPLPIALLTPPRYGDQHSVYSLFPQGPGDLIAGLPRHPDIEENEVRRNGRCDGQCFAAGICDMYVVTREFQKECQTFHGIPIVVRYEDPSLPR